MSDVRPMPEVEVRTAGAVRDATSVSVARQMPGLGRGHVGVSGGLLAATAEATLLEPGNDVVRHAKFSPWKRSGTFPPMDGDEATVDVGGTRTFTGVVEDVDGAASRHLSVSMVDSVDRLRRRVSFEPLANPMRGSTAQSAVSPVSPLLRHEHYVSACMRAAGFWHIPRPTAEALLFIPMQGSVMPEGRGFLVDGVTQGFSRWYPTWWGLGVSDTNGYRWRMAPDINPAGPAYNRWDLTFFVGRDLTESTSSLRRLVLRNHAQGATTGTMQGYVEVYLPSSTTINIELHGTGTSTIHADVTVPYNAEKPWVRIERNPSGQTSRIYHGDDVVWSGSIANPSSSAKITDLAFESGGGHRVVLGPVYLTGGGPGADLDLDNLNATLRMSPLWGAMTAGPFIENADALTLLREVSQAVQASVWLDRHGRLHWAGASVLEAQEPSATITADADLLDVSWRMSVRDLAHRVTVSSEHPTVGYSGLGTMLLWQGGAVEMSGGDVYEVWATAGPSEDWLFSREPIRRQGEGLLPNESCMGGVLEGGATPAPWATSIYLSVAHSRINSQTRKFVHEAQSLPSGQVVVLRATEQSGRSSLSEVPLPRVVGFGRIDWNSQLTTAAATGPDMAPDLDHNAGRWVQGDDCQVLADWLQARLESVRPVLEDLPIVWRDDLDLGQVVTVVEDEVYGVELTCLVVGIREAHSPEGGARMWVSLRVLDHEVIE